MRHRRIVKHAHHVRQSIHVAQMSGVSAVFQRFLADGSNVNVLNRCVRQFLRIVKRGQAIEPIVRYFGYANMGLPRIGTRLIRKMRFSQNAKQGCLAHLRQADDSSFHK